MVGFELLENVGLNHRWSDAVHDDAFLSELFAQRFGQSDHASFGGAVVCGVGIAFFASNRSDVDDATVAALEHHWHDLMAAMKTAIQIDVHHAFPFLRIRLPQGGVRSGYARVVDQDVDASEFGLSGLYGSADRLQFRHIHSQWQNKALPAEFGSRFLCSSGVGVPDSDGGPGGEKSLDDGAANATGTTGDHGALVLQVDLVHAAPMLAQNLPRMQARSLFLILFFPFFGAIERCPAHPLLAQPLDHAHVPAFEQFYLPEDDDAFVTEGGLLLLAELNCVACHAAPTPWKPWLTPTPGPDLQEVGSRLEIDALWRFVRSPQHRKPGTRMPGLFAGNEEQDADEIEALATYLASLRMSDPTPVLPASDAARGRDLYHQVGCVACHEPALDYRPRSLPADAEVEPPGLPSSPLALADDYTESGLARFLLDPVAIRPASRMPSQHLSRAEAADLAAYLHLDRQTGSFQERAILQLAPRTVNEGRTAFVRHRCVTCHHTGETHPPPSALRSLDQLDSASSSGCLSERRVSGVPFYDLSPLQTRALSLALRHLQQNPTSLRPSRSHEMARLNCYACHDHEGRGGPEISRAPYFTPVVRQRPNDDLVNLPPSLDGVSNRLSASALLERLTQPSALSEKFSVRMPRFHPTSLQYLLEAFEKTTD